MENFQAFKSDAAEGNTNREMLDLLYKNAPVTLFSSMAVAVLLYSVVKKTPNVPNK